MENSTLTKQKLFHENVLDFYDHLWELKYKLQIERIICNGTNNDEQFSNILFIYNALYLFNIVGINGKLLQL